jgi:hypothetical protein
VLQYGWEQPPNVDFVHFGALRGLDFAKHHLAAVSIGRQELPIGLTDAYAAAFTYDDDEPEEPLYTGEQIFYPKFHRTLKLRSGQDYIYSVPAHPGRWGGVIQDQYREQELLQFLGRLRPVYRESAPPVYYALTNALPDQIIWDGVATVEKITDVNGCRTPLWEIARRCQGILSPELASAVCADLVNGEPDAIFAAFGRAGFDCLTGQMEGNVHTRGWRTIRYTLARQEHEQLCAWIAGYVSDPHSLVSAVFKDVGEEISAIEVSELPASPGIATKAVRYTGGMTKIPDKLDQALGLPEHHRTLEQNWRNQIAREVKKEVAAGSALLELHDLERVIVHRLGEHGPVAMTFEDRLAYRTLQAFWAGRIPDTTNGKSQTVTLIEEDAADEVISD